MDLEDSFIKLAKNKDITDEELFDEICYIYAKNERDFRLKQIRSHHVATQPHVPFLDINGVFETVKKIRERNPTLRPTDGRDVDGKFIRNQISYISIVSPISHLTQIIENYEMKKRIRSLEQTLKTFMEQTKVERLSQEAVMQSLSNELDEFQEEFYDCQSEVKEQKEHIGLIEDAIKETIQTVTRLECVPFVKDKTD